jgi:hypothetical protein
MKKPIIITTAIVAVAIIARLCAGTTAHAQSVDDATLGITPPLEHQPAIEFERKRLSSVFTNNILRPRCDRPSCVGLGICICD